MKILRWNGTAYLSWNLYAYITTCQATMGQVQLPQTTLFPRNQCSSLRSKVVVLLNFACCRPSYMWNHAVYRILCMIFLIYFSAVSIADILFLLLVVLCMSRPLFIYLFYYWWTCMFLVYFFAHNVLWKLLFPSFSESSIFHGYICWNSK